MSFGATFRINGNEYSVSAPITGEAGRRCALSFNPGGDLATEMVKVAHAATMQTLIDQRNAAPPENATIQQCSAHSDRMRCIATALTDLEKAQMMGVKALHTAANAGA